MEDIAFIFNGDGDGLCAAHQMILSGIIPTTFITGVKRDTLLVRHAHGVSNGHLYVFDIEMEKNESALKEALARGNQVTWFDHHQGKREGRISHPFLTAVIETEPWKNTSWLVSRFLEDRFFLWALVGLFGDHLGPTAFSWGQEKGISLENLQKLQELGEALNYNSYGDGLEDLLYPPADLLKAMEPYEDPFRFLVHSSVTEDLRAARYQDLATALKSIPRGETFVFLPPTPWARRIIGELAHFLAQEQKEKPVAILMENPQGGYRVSVRAPVMSPYGAGKFCLGYPTGGGREAAGGINALPAESLTDFKAGFEMYTPRDWKCRIYEPEI